MVRNDKYNLKVIIISKDPDIFFTLFHKKESVNKEDSFFMKNHHIIQSIAV